MFKIILLKRFCVFFLIIFSFCFSAFSMCETEEKVIPENLIAFHNAININDTKKASEIFPANNIDLLMEVDALNALQRALILGVKFNDLTIFKMILQNIEDKKDKFVLNDHLLLKTAILFGRKEVIEMLIRVGIPVDFEYPNTKLKMILLPHYFAASVGECEIGQILKEAYDRLPKDK